MSQLKYVGVAINDPRVKVSRDPQRGWQAVATYDSVTETAADLIIAATLRDQRVEKERNEDGTFTVSVYTPDVLSGTADQNDVYELLSNHIEKDLYEHPKARALPADTIHAIKAFLKNLPKDQFLPQILTGPDPSDPADWSNISGDALTLFDLLVKGQSKFMTEEWVLRFSLTVSSRAAVIASFLNQGKLFDDTQLVTVLDGGVAVPGGIGFAIIDITSNLPYTAPSGYAWAWLKKAPKVRQQYPGKVTIEQEWWLDCWSTFVYDPL